MIFVIGSPRSGTTWLGKIFDSHADTYYIHEPDSVIKSTEVPYFPDPDEIGSLIPKAQSYIDRLSKSCNLKCIATRPAFSKSFYSPFENVTIPAKLALLKQLDNTARSLGLRIDIEGKFKCHPVADQKAVKVIKSVDSSGRTLLFSRARPESKVVHIVRHPCGFVASQLRGRRLKLLQDVIFFETIARMALSKRMGWTVDTLKRMLPEEQIACSWAAINDKVIDETQGVSNYKRVTYENLCTEPEQTTKELFSFCGLKTDQQTLGYIKKCLSVTEESASYFQTTRNPTTAVEKWKSELSKEQIDRIKRTVAGSQAWSHFADS